MSFFNLSTSPVILHLAFLPQVIVILTLVSHSHPFVASYSFRIHPFLDRPNHYKCSSFKKEFQLDLAEREKKSHVTFLFNSHFLIFRIRMKVPHLRLLKPLNPFFACLLGELLDFRYLSTKRAFCYKDRESLIHVLVFFFFY